MINHWSRTPLRFAVIGLLIAAFGLAACGRKGGLDAPPGGSLAGSPDAAADNSGEPAQAGAKKRIPIDALLD